MKFPRAVYAIRHNRTQKVYIGSSSKLDIRIRSHLSKLRCGMHSVDDMQKDYDEYGEDYTITVLDVIECFKDKDKEYAWMQTYKSHLREFGYNYQDRHNFKTYPEINFAELNKAIRACGMTHSEVAEKIGITPGQFNYRIYNDKLTAGDIYKLVRVLKINEIQKVFFPE